MIEIIGTGLSGLVGSRVVEMLNPDYSFEDISRKTGTDITDPDAVSERIIRSQAAYVIHMAAYTDVETAEKEKALQEQSQAWQINVNGTRNVIHACEIAKKKLIYISTDMVFPGNKPLPERYIENDERGPVNWYARTKYEGEKIVEKSKIPWTILRIAYPYRAIFEKKEYVRIFISLLQQGRAIKAVSDHYYTPTFIDDIAQVLHTVVQNELTGIYHAGGTQIVSPYEIAEKIAQEFNFDKELIGRITRDDFFHQKAKRPFNLSLNSGKIEKLGVHLHSFDEGLQEIKKQIHL